MKEHPVRKQWSSRFGFLMAMVGSAVGLGNLWRFPYVAGEQGGALFLICYIVMVALVGFSVMAAEIALGRRAKANVVSAFQLRNKKWGIAGIFAVAVCFIIVSYYGVIGGWLVRYIGGYLTGGSFVASGDYAKVFQSFQSSPGVSFAFLAVFVALSIAVIILGVKKGIEKVSKILMPALFVMLVFIMIVSLSMPGSGEGVKFFLIPDWERMQSSGSGLGGVGGMIVAALGQAFFSLSVGFGISATYGSYVGKKENIPRNALFVCLADTLVAVIAGFAVLPAVFASNLPVTAGPSLIFETLPAVFARLGGFGVAVGFVFFALVFFAAITSTISLFEVIVAAISEKLNLKRVWVAVGVGVAALLVGMLIVFSYAGWLGEVNLLNLFDTVSTSILLPVSAILLCIYTGFVWKPKNAIQELTNDGTLKFRLAKVWSFTIRFVAPVLIGVILIVGIVGLF